MHRVALSLVLLAAATTTAFAQDWTPLAPLPQARQGAAGAAIGESFYVLGGNSGSDLARVDVWTEGSGWTSASPMSVTRQQPGAVALDGFVYAIGGLAGNALPEVTVERYDPSTDTWSNVAPLPSGRALMGAAVWNGDIFVLGGESVFGELLPESYRYDVATNTWSTVAPIPTPVSGPGAAVMGNEIYVIGGASTSFLAEVQVYDASSDVWSLGPALPEPLWLPAVAAFDGRIWVMGGFDRFFSRSDRVYSLGTDGVWQSEATLPQGLAASATGSNGSRLVIAGGMGTSGQPLDVALTRFVAAPPPPPPPPAEDTLTVNAEFRPRTLNVASRGSWVSVCLTAAWDITKLDPATVRVNGVPCDLSFAPKLDEEEGSLSMKFARSAFADLTDGSHELPVHGETFDGTPVAGIAEVRITGENPKKKIARSLAPSLKPVRQAGRTAAVQLSLAQPSQVTIQVLDVQGRVVDDLGTQTFAAGEHELQWTPSHRRAGVFFIRARLNGTVLTTRTSVLH